MYLAKMAPTLTRLIFRNLKWEAREEGKDDAFWKYVCDTTQQNINCKESYEVSYNTPKVTTSTSEKRYESMLTIPKVTVQERNLTIDCGVNNKIVKSWKFTRVISIPETPKCTATSMGHLTYNVSCSTDKVFPGIVCKFFQNHNGEFSFLDSPIEYKMAHVDDGKYCKASCAMNVTLIKPGNYTFIVQMFGGHNDTDYALPAPDHRDYFFTNRIERSIDYSGNFAEVEQPPINICPDKSTSVNLTCKTYLLHDRSVTFTWQINDTPVVGNPAFDEYSCKGGSSFCSKMSHYQFTPTKADDGKMVYCKAILHESGHSKIQLIQDSKQLSVRWPPASPPQFKIGSTALGYFHYVDLGSTVSVVCQVDGGNPASLSDINVRCLDRNKTEIPMSSHKTSNSLTMNFTVTSDVHLMYCVCSAQHVTGCYNQSTQVTFALPSLSARLEAPAEAESESLRSVVVYIIAGGVTLLVLPFLLGTILFIRSKWNTLYYYFYSAGSIRTASSTYYASVRFFRRPTPPTRRQTSVLVEDQLHYASASLVETGLPVDDFCGDGYLLPHTKAPPPPPPPTLPPKPKSRSATKSRKPLINAPPDYPDRSLPPMPRSSVIRSVGNFVRKVSNRRKETTSVHGRDTRLHVNGADESNHRSGPLDSNDESESIYGVHTSNQSGPLDSNGESIYGVHTSNQSGPQDESPFGTSRGTKSTENPPRLPPRPVQLSSNSAVGVSRSTDSTNNSPPLPPQPIRKTSDDNSPIESYISHVSTPQKLPRKLQETPCTPNTAGDLQSTQMRPYRPPRTVTSKVSQENFSNDVTMNAKPALLKNTCFLPPGTPQNIAWDKSSGSPQHFLHTLPNSRIPPQNNGTFRQDKCGRNYNAQMAPKPYSNITPKKPKTTSLHGSKSLEDIYCNLGNLVVDLPPAVPERPDWLQSNNGKSPSSKAAMNSSHYADMQNMSSSRPLSNSTENISQWTSPRAQHQHQHQHQHQRQRPAFNKQISEPSFHLDPAKNWTTINIDFTNNPDERIYDGNENMIGLPVHVTEDFSKTVAGDDRRRILTETRPPFNTEVKSQTLQAFPPPGPFGVSTRPHTHCADQPLATPPSTPSPNPANDFVPASATAASLIRPTRPSPQRRPSQSTAQTPLAPLSENKDETGEDIYMDMTGLIRQQSSAGLTERSPPKPCNMPPRHW